MDPEIEYLKNTQKGPINVTALKSLKQLKKIFKADVDAPGPFKQVLENWNKFRILAISSVVHDEYPALTKCWKHLQAELGEWAFDESMIDAWCFFNFPCHEGRSFAQIFAKDEDSPEPLKEFAKELGETRLGLYQVVLGSGKFLRLKELLTGRVFEVHNIIDTPPAGEISLARLLPVGDKFMIFGSPSGFPGAYKDRLEDMLESKMLMYYGDGDSAYEEHMTLSGPYWMSVVSENADVDILDPGYHERFYSEGFRVTSLPEWMKPPETEDPKKEKAKKNKRKAARKARKRNK